MRRTGEEVDVGNETGRGSFQGGRGKTAVASPTRLNKRVQRKPPLPTNAHPTVSAKGEARGGGRKRDKPPKPRRRSIGQGVRGSSSLDGEGGVVSVPEGESYGLDRANLVLQLRQAKDEIEGLRRDVASSAQERLMWQQRDDEVSLAVSRLENRRGALEASLRAKSDAANSEVARTRAAEGRFDRLLVWARKEEGRRRQAEERLGRAFVAGEALEARVKAVEEEARESNRQLDARRFRLEGALEDLRQRTLDNERLEHQAKVIRGEVHALRELSDARGSEIRELREKLTRVVKEAKGMSSGNVNLRKQLCAEQERSRAAERSRSKQDGRRRTEMEGKNDIIHTLRYRVQELETRLSSEVARRHGAEEDARRSQEMERRSMEELTESRNSTTSIRAGLNQSLSVHASERLPGVVSASTGPAWKSCNDVGVAAIASGARSPMTSDMFCSARRQYGEAAYRTEGRWRDATAKRDDRASDQRFFSTPACVPSSLPPSLAPTLPPSASSSRVRGYPPPPPPLSPAALSPRPTQLARSPVELDSRRLGRPRPRQAPSEGGGGGDRCGDSDGVGDGAVGDVFPGRQRGGAWEEDSVGDSLERGERRCDDDNHADDDDDSHSGVVSRSEGALFDALL